GAIPAAGLPSAATARWRRQRRPGPAGAWRCCRASWAIPIPAWRRSRSDALPPPREIWLLIRPDLAEVPRVRAVADALADLFRKNRALFG
ncbi:hypothetical protein P409_32935, partial [Inquilinus limosus MP06]